jgi:hypothetical protein
MQQLPLSQVKVKTLIQKCRHFNVFPVFFSHYFPLRESHPVSEVLRELGGKGFYVDIITDRAALF